jgi:hypothetical protein
MHRFVTILVGSLAVALAPACGSVTTAPSCSPTFTPCGGDVVGTWTSSAVCGATAQLMMACPGASTSFMPTASATYTFNADGSFSLSLTADESGTQTLPASCLSGIQSCALLEMTSTTQGLTTSTTGCTGNPSQSCTCTFTAKGTLTDTGTYTTAGTGLTMKDSSGPSSPLGYCVTGNQLELSLITTPTNTTYLILTKQ